MHTLNPALAPRMLKVLNVDVKGKHASCLTLLNCWINACIHSPALDHDGIHSPWTPRWGRLAVGSVESLNDL